MENLQKEFETIEIAKAAGYNIECEINDDSKCVEDISNAGCGLFMVIVSIISFVIILAFIKIYSLIK